MYFLIGDKMKVKGKYINGESCIKDLVVIAENKFEYMVHNYSVHGNKISIIEFKSFHSFHEKSLEWVAREVCVNLARLQLDTPHQIMFLMKTTSESVGSDSLLKYQVYIFNVKYDTWMRYVCKVAKNCINGIASISNYLKKSMPKYTGKVIISREDKVLAIIDLSERKKKKETLQVCNIFAFDGYTDGKFGDLAQHKKYSSFVNCSNNHLLFNTLLLKDYPQEKFYQDVVKYIANFPLGDPINSSSALEVAIRNNETFNISFYEHVGNTLVLPMSDGKFHINTFEADVDKTPACGSAVASVVFNIAKRYGKMDIKIYLNKKSLDREAYGSDGVIIDGSAIKLFVYNVKYCNTALLNISTALHKDDLNY